MDSQQFIREIVEKIQKSANVRAVFGEPVEKYGRTVIPVAKVTVCGCGRISDAGKADAGRKGRNSAGGFGLKINAVPVGYVEMGKGEIGFSEIRDEKRIIMAGVVLAAFGIFSFSRVLLKYFKD